MTSERFALKGALSDGLFSSEAVLSFQDAHGIDVSLIAPMAMVIRKGEGGVVRVRVLQSKGARYLVQLPGEVYGAGQEVVVNEEQLEKV